MMVIRSYLVFMPIICLASYGHAGECRKASDHATGMLDLISASGGKSACKDIEKQIQPLESAIKECGESTDDHTLYGLCRSYEVCAEHEKANKCYHRFINLNQKEKQLEEEVWKRLKNYQVKFIVQGADGTPITKFEIRLNNDDKPQPPSAEPDVIEISRLGVHDYSITVPGFLPYKGKLNVNDPPQYQVVTVDQLVPQLSPPPPVCQSISIGFSTGYLLAYSPTHGLGNELLFHGPSSGVNFMDNGVKSSLMCSTNSPCSYVEGNQADVPEFAHAPLPVQISMNYHRDRWAFGLLGIYSHGLGGSHWSLAGAGRVAYDIRYGKNLASEVGIVIGGGSATNISGPSGGEKRFLHGLDGKYLVVNSEVELEKNLGNMFIGFDFGLHFIREERFSVFGKLQPTLWLGVPEFKQSNLNWGVVLPILLGIEFELWGSGGARSKNR